MQSAALHQPAPAPRPLIVVAAGGLGRDLAAYAPEAGFDVVGFLHDEHAHPGSLDGVGVADRVLGALEGHVVRDDVEYAIGLGDVAPRAQVAARLLDGGARLATVVHPLAWVAPSASIGAGVVIAPFAFVGPNAVVQDLTVINTHASVAHDAHLGRGSVLAPYAALTGRVRVDEEVYVATHATIAPRRRVGRGSTVGAGSVVLHDVGEEVLAHGNPARTRRAHRHV